MQSLTSCWNGVFIHVRYTQLSMYVRQLVGLPEVFDLHRGGVLFDVRHLTNNDIFNKLNVHYKCVMVSIEFFFRVTDEYRLL